MIKLKSCLNRPINSKFIRLLFTILFVFFAINLFSQNKIIFINQTRPDDPGYKTFKYKSEAQLEQKKLKLAIKNIKHGYLGFSIDSTIYLNTIRVYYTNGDLYQFTSQLSDPNLKLNTPLSLNYESNQQIKKDIIDFYQNKGYPNVQIITNSQIIDSTHTIQQTLSINRGEYFSFSGLKSDYLTNSEIRYLEHLSRIEPKKSYQQTKVDQFKTTVNNSAIYKFDSLKLEYQNNTVSITPYLTNQKNNTINGWIGLQSTDESNTDLTGNFDLSLVNALKHGEKIVFTWNRPKTESQELSASVDWPYIFNLPTGIALSYGIDKEDTTYTSQNYILGLLFPIHPIINLKGYFSQNRLQEHDSLSYKSSQSLYGIELDFSKTNRKTLPQKGYSGTIDVNLGNHESNSNYQSLILNLEATINFYLKLPIGNLRITNQTGIIENDSVSQYELFRIGGINSIRGFNERSIYCQKYTFINLEYRIYFDNYSFIHLFYDDGYMNKSTSNRLESLGAGLTLSTQAGIISITYAIGKTQSSYYKINQSLIHVGYAYTF